MSYFNTITYDPSNVEYNTELPIYLDKSEIRDQTDFE